MVTLKSEMTKQESHSLAITRLNIPTTLPKFSHDEMRDAKAIVVQSIVLMHKPSRRIGLPKTLLWVCTGLLLSFTCTMRNIEMHKAANGPGTPA